MATKNTHKKLKKFFGEKTTAVKKVRTLVSYTGSVKDEEAKAFFIENHEQIFSLISERFSECETAPKPVRRGKTFLTEFISLLQLLKKFVELCLADFLTYTDDIEALLVKILGYGNKHSIRIMGYEILLHVIQILQSMNDLEDQFLVLLAEGINLQPFYPENAEVPSSILSGKSIAPGSTLPSIEEAVELWEKFLIFVGEKPEKFAFWFGILKTLYLPTLFPSIIALGIKPVLPVVVDEKVFKQCPGQLQERLASKYTKWIEVSELTTVIWDDMNGDLMMELCKHACNLPISYATTIALVIEKFRIFLFESGHPKDSLGGKLSKYHQQFIANVSQVFYSKSTADYLEIHESICKKVLLIYRQLGLDNTDEIIWKKLQETLLSTITDVLGNANPFAVKHITTTMAQNLFETLYLIWLRCPYTTDEMWVNFSNKISAMVQWKALLDEWKEKVIQLTNILKAYYYEPYIKENEHRTRAIRTKTTDSILEQSAFTVDTNLVSINWNKEKIKKAWYTIIHILGNLNLISMPENFATAYSCCSAVIETLLLAEEQLPIDTPTIIPICKIFLPWLIEACSVEEKRNRGRLLAYTILCRLFCRLQAAKSIEQEILVHFYRVIKQGLQSGHSSVIWTIIRHAWNIFALSLPGATILIPDFIREISNLLRYDNKSSIPAEVQLKSLQIITSLINYPNHFKDMQYISFSSNELGGMVDIMTSEQLRDKISTIFITSIKNTKILPNNMTHVIYSITLLIFDDLYEFNPSRKDSIRECMKLLLTNTTNSESIVALTALECLSSLSSCCELFNKLDSTLVMLLMYTLSDNIITLTTSSKLFTEKQDVIIDHFYCLLEWVLSIGYRPLELSLIEKIFEAIEIGILGSGISLDQYDNYSPSVTIGSASSTSSNQSSSGQSSSSSQSSSNQSTSTSSQSQSTAAGSLTSLQNVSVSSVSLHTLNNPSSLSQSNNPSNPSNASSGQTASLSSTSERSSTISSHAPLLSPSSNSSTANASSNSSTSDSMQAQTNHFQQQKSKRKTRFIDKIGVGGSIRLNKKNVAGLMSIENSDHPMKIRLAAEAFLQTFLVRLNNFPIPEGSTEGPLIDCEATNDDSLYFVYYQSIFSLLQVKHPQNPNKNIVQATVRDSTGKYQWDCELECESEDYFASVNRVRRNEDANQAEDTSGEIVPTNKIQAEKAKYMRTTNEIPQYQEILDYTEIDMAEQMLLFLHETNNSLIPSGKAIQEKHASKIEKISHLMNKQVAEEKTQIIKFDEVTRTPLPLKPVVPVPHSPFHLCRLFLTHMGYLEEISSKRFKFLANSQRLRRSLHELDKINSREMIKIGLIYVDQGQENQNQILANDNGSPRYVQFVQGLGWSIDVATHGAYKGGLHANSTGASAPYFSSPTCEVIFHDITRMPTTDDPQQIHKKRHVGNDNIHIVWSEHRRDYNPATITSQFNDAHIVIYPLDNGLNRVQVFKKDKLRTFGPLTSGMVVPSHILPILVRLTAINANTSSRVTNDLYRKPYVSRLDLIHEIINRYKAEKSLPDFVADLFPCPEPVAASEQRIVTHAPASNFVVNIDHKTKREKKPKNVSIAIGRDKLNVNKPS